jgi:F-type H+-transporting ATPase subunit epsilon
MAGTLQLEVATPERLLVRETVREVVVPGEGGALGILPEHAPLVSELGEGPLCYTLESGARNWMSVCGGVVEVLPDHVRVLASKAERANDIDIKRAEESLKRSNERLLHPTVDLDVARALNAMRRAQARLAAAKEAGAHK